MADTSPKNIETREDRFRFSIGWMLKATALASLLMLFTMLSGWAAIVAFSASAGLSLLFRSDLRSNVISRIVCWFFVAGISALLGMSLGAYINFRVELNPKPGIISACSILASIIGFALINEDNRLSSKRLATNLSQLFLLGILGAAIGGAMYGLFYLFIGDHRLDVVYHLTMLLIFGLIAGVHVGLVIGGLKKKG